MKSKLIAVALAAAVVVAVAVTVYRWVADAAEAFTGPDVEAARSEEKATLRGQGKLAFARLLPRGARNEWVIFVGDGDGSRARRLLVGRNPVWSPDGRRLAFERGGGEIWIADADGRNARMLTDFGSNPCWSPDARGSRSTAGCSRGSSSSDSPGRG